MEDHLELWDFNNSYLQIGETLHFSYDLREEGESTLIMLVMRPLGTVGRSW